MGLGLKISLENPKFFIFPLWVKKNIFGSYEKVPLAKDRLASYLLQVKSMLRLGITMIEDVLLIFFAIQGWKIADNARDLTLVLGFQSGTFGFSVMLIYMSIPRNGM